MALRKILEALGICLRLAPQTSPVSSGSSPPGVLCKVPTPPVFLGTVFAGGLANASCGVNITGHRLPGAPPWA